LAPFRGVYGLLLALVVIHATCLLVRRDIFFKEPK